MSTRIEVTERPPAATPDYSDAFAVARTSSDSRSAEAWARAALEQTPPVLRRGLPLAWESGLGLRLGPRPSPEHVLGWRIVSTEPSVIVLEAPSPLLTAHLVLRVEPTRVVLTTFVRYEKPAIARPVWTLGSPVHRLTVQYLLNHAAAEHG